MTAPLRVLHVASHEINVGDGALNDAIRSRLGMLVEQPIEFSLADTISPPNLTAEDVDRYDLVLVGGGGAISNGVRNRRNGTVLPMDLAEYRRARAPFVFVALGYNLFHGARYRWAAELTELLDIARDKGDRFSVRNDGSIARLTQEIGPAVGLVSEIPDPGFFVAAPPIRPTEVRDRPYMILQVAADAPGQRALMGSFGDLSGQQWLEALAGKLAEIARAAVREFALDVLVTPHIPPDLMLTAKVAERCYSDKEPMLVHRPIRFGGTPHPHRAVEFFGRYAAAELIVGMRGHAVICAAGLRRPVIAIATHPKVDGFMRHAGLVDWVVTPSTNLANDVLDHIGRIRSDDGMTHLTARDAGVRSYGAHFDGFLRTALTSAGIPVRSD